MLYLSICFGVWANLFVFWQKNVRVSMKQPTNTEKNWRIKLVKNLFFLTHFWTWSRKVWTTLEKENRRIVRTTFKVFKGTFSGRFFRMKKLWSSFLVVERNYWAFGVNFLSKVLKTAAYGCSGTFWGSFGEKSICLIVFGLWAKKTVVWQKFYGTWQCC